jgi:glycosyltransferase involved in cell wall biosynthesis
MWYKKSRIINKVYSYLIRNFHIDKFFKKNKILHVPIEGEKEKRRVGELEKLALLEEKFGKLDNGVSVIIGTYKGETKIDRCLDSLANQTLDPSLFEIIFVINGERDNTDKKIHSAFANLKTINYSILYSEKPSLSAARNIGIKAAKKKYLCFLDDDDFLSHNYLEEMLAFCDDFTIVFSQIVDVDENGNLNPNNVINNQIVQHSRVETTEMHKLTTGNTMSGCKMFPTILVKGHPFIEELKSGEDVVLFTQLLTDWDFIFQVVPPHKNVIYYRLFSSNSMSRRPLSYEFNVLERIAVLTHLEKQLLKVEYPHRINLIKSKISAQSGFIRRFLEQNEDLRWKVYADIIKSKLVNFPFHIFNENKAKTLVVSYCFPPYVDTSGTVVAKRIRSEGELVDVIYNKMDKKRAISHNLSLIANEFIDRKFELDTITAFSDWDGIEKFVVRGLKIINGQISKKGHYEKVYSRAMWPASHFLAYAYKVQNPEVKWIAEFSDPLIFDIHGRERMVRITNSDFLSDIKNELRRRNAPIADSDNLFFWCEYLPFVFADKIIFTNENQKQYMLNRFPIQAIKSLVLEKCTVKPQPTLPEMFYHMHESEYFIDHAFVNLAYFGAFYDTRKLNELVKAVEEMDDGEREKLKIHIFTDKPDEFSNEIKGTPLASVFCIGPYVDYFQFLNLTTKFDCLIVNDAATKHVKEINPYLPSKISDYLGSGVSIWGLCEEGSILSRLDIAYKSPIGDVMATKKMLTEIILNKEEQKRLVT